jgi:hypothetical protein
VLLKSIFDVEISQGEATCEKLDAFVRLRKILEVLRRRQTRENPVGMERSATPRATKWAGTIAINRPGPQ